MSDSPSAPSAEEIVAEIKSRPAPQRSIISVERILVPTDGSGPAFKALNEAIELAAVTGAEITLLMVVDLDKNVAAFEQVSLGGYVPYEMLIAAYQFLADLIHVIPPEVKAHVRAEFGIPGEKIVEVAEGEESDLIVMGDRGFSALRRFLIGSVSTYVMQQAPCPVLLCKGMPDDWDEDDNYIADLGEK